MRKTPQDARQNCTKESGKQEQVSEKGYAKKAGADGADQKQRSGVIAENKDVLCFLQGDLFLFVKLSSDFCTHGIAGKDAKKKGEGSNTIQSEEGLHNGGENFSHPFRCAHPQQ